MTRLAAIAVERGWERIDFQVLGWNPARGFYRRLGIEHLGDWLRYGGDGAALRRLAARRRLTPTRDLAPRNPGAHLAVDDLTQPGKGRRDGAVGIAQSSDPARPTEIVGVAGHV